ncbi:MAG TPA: PKD domain-containing protein [Bacteroidales bacterium]|nr:PKD domain-containing protein [Bacteroidales bacterium]HOX78420.1 PKD domain-containing protein [Bacteroidales bacterium]
MEKTIKLLGALLAFLAFTTFIACDKEEEEPDVIASFTFAVDQTDFMKVQFTNQSTNFSALSWNFGDNSAVSAETNPVHIFPDLGDFVVTLTATSLNGKVTDVFTATVTISDPNAELTKLVGTESKTWKLIRDVSTGRYPLLVFPYNVEDPFTPTTIWWAMGLNNDELANRPCLLNDEWTFYRDGTLEFNNGGDTWAEGGVFKAPDNKCIDDTEAWIGVNDEDISAWGSGTHAFELIAGTPQKLKAIGNGAHIGFFKSATEYEVMKLNPMVQDEVTYDVVKLTDGTTDTLIVQCNYYFEVGDAAFGGSWRYTLVHYDDPNDEPPIPTNNPNPNFSYVVDGLTVTLTNNSLYCDSYLWDFGDGGTSTEAAPTHTYAAEGIYVITLTGTNANGTASITSEVWISATVLTEEILKGGGTPWKVKVGEKTVFVGSGLGQSNWWAVPAADLQEGGGWACMTDDEFTFLDGGVFTYDGKGVVRNDGYLAEGQGCIEEGTVTGNGAAFLSCTDHSYVFTPATGTTRPIIDLTNGTDRAAFIGFYKGYYGGENGAAPGAEQPLPNGGLTTNKYEIMGYVNDGTKEYILVSVDITADHNGTAAWSVILER